MSMTCSLIELEWVGFGEFVVSNDFRRSEANTVPKYARSATIPISKNKEIKLNLFFIY